MNDLHVRRTRRWRGVVAVSLGALAIALLANRPDVLLVSVFGIAYVVYPQVSTPPEPSLSIDRRLSEDAPDRGDPVEVTVTLTNTGDDTLFDVRFVDGVPPALAVSEGSPRRGAVLRPGGSVAYSYTVTAERGRHPFEPATVVARDLSGEHEVETTVSTETEIDCTATTADVPLRRQTLPSVGRVLADEGGSGVEFDHTREYRPGDPMSRIDWNRYAQTGDPTTVQFRREQAARVVIVVDARSVAYRGREGEPHAVAYAVSAARQVADALLGGRNRIGVAGFGREFVWLAPGAGREHDDDVQHLLTTHGTFAPTPPDAEPDHDEQVDRLLERLTEGTQVILVSPLCDDAVVETARRLEVNGHAVGVISPAVTRTDSRGRRLASLERRHRVGSLRNADVPVVEWEPDRPLASAMAAAQSGGSG